MDGYVNQSKVWLQKHLMNMMAIVTILTKTVPNSLRMLYLLEMYNR